MDQVISNNSRWLWFSALAAFGVLTLTNGRLLLASGFLLLAVFAFFNNPPAATPSHLPRPTALLGLSWVCGVLGVIAVLAAAVEDWL